MGRLNCSRQRIIREAGFEIAGFEIAGFEIVGVFIRRQTVNAEGTGQKFRDSACSRQRESTVYLTISGISLINITNSVGPSTEPCVILLLTHAQDESSLHSRMALSSYARYRIYQNSSPSLMWNRIKGRCKICVYDIN